MRTAFAVVGCVLFVAYVLIHVAGCGARNEDVKAAIETACDSTQLVTYERELDQCIGLGKEAGAYAVYEECARGADVRFRNGHAACRGAK